VLLSTGERAFLYQTTYFLNEPHAAGPVVAKSRSLSGRTEPAANVVCEDYVGDSRGERGLAPSPRSRHALGKRLAATVPVPFSDAAENGDRHRGGNVSAHVTPTWATEPVPLLREPAPSVDRRTANGDNATAPWTAEGDSPIFADTKIGTVP
jgi:hypothetical protein